MNKIKKDSHRRFNYGKLNDLGSCKGHSCIVATCDSSREREASKELVNLINQSIEYLYVDKTSSSLSTDKNSNLSISELLAEEIAMVSNVNQRNKSSQNVVSIMTDMKGIVLAKILLKDAIPNDIITQIFERIKSDKRPVSKYIVRLIPLTKVFYPNQDDLFINFYELAQIEFPNVSNNDALLVYNDIIKKRSDKKMKVETETSNDSALDGDEINEIKKQKTENSLNTFSSEVVEDNSVVSNVIDKTDLEPQRLPFETDSTFEKESQNTDQYLGTENKEISSQSIEKKLSQPLKYDIIYKARNHNILQKKEVIQNVNTCVPPNSSITYRNPDVIVIVEAIKCICGVSILRNYNQLMEYNIRKYQNEFSIAGDGFITSNSITNTTNNTLEK